VEHSVVIVKGVIGCKIHFYMVFAYSKCVFAVCEHNQVAHYHLKRHAPKQVTVNKAVFEEVKGVLFYTTIEEF